METTEAPPQVDVTAVGQEEINPHRLYRVREVAALLDLHEDTVYRIPERTLPKTRVGPGRGRTRWKGSDLVTYLNGKPAARSGLRVA